MKVILVGAHGTVGKHAYQALRNAGHEIIQVGRTTGDLQVKIEDAADVARLYKQVGKFDAVVSASGEVAFAPLSDLKGEQWSFSLGSKLMGQINLVQQATPYISEGGSFTLVSGILGKEQIPAGTVAATINSAIEGFVKSAACELPKRLRINVVSPTVLKDSIQVYGSFFPGFAPVEGEKVGLAFLKSVSGNQTGKVIEVL